MLKHQISKVAHDQAGSTLILVLVAAAIGSIVAISSMSTMANMQSSLNSVKFRSDADIFNEEVRALLSSPTACSNSFGGLAVGPLATFNIAVLNDGSAAPGVPRYVVGNIYGDRTLFLNSMGLAGFVAGSDPGTARKCLTAFGRERLPT